MLNDLKEKYEYKKAVAVLFALSCACGLLCSVLGIFAVPFAAAFFAALYVFSSKRKYGIAFVCISAALAVAVGFLSDFVSAFAAVIALVIGLFMGFLYLIGRSKPEAATITVIATLAVIVAAIWLFAALGGSGGGFGAVREFYSKLYSEIKTESLEVFAQRLNALPNYTDAQRTEMQDLFVKYMDSFVLMLPAIVAIAALILAGLSSWAFRAVVIRYAKDEDYIINWRFTTSNLFAVFYIVLAILNIFVSGVSTYSVSVINLYSVFNLIYAYIGYNFVSAILAQKMRPRMARLIVVFAVLLFSSFALQVLAVAGVIFTFMNNKAAKVPFDDGGDNNSHNESENDDEKN